MGSGLQSWSNCGRRRWLERSRRRPRDHCGQIQQNPTCRVRIRCPELHGRGGIGADGGSARGVGASGGASSWEGVPGEVERGWEEADRPK
ncbi:hypothetical protein E2562_000242 [Oryza meyeriana var. granulata]|uniref:Uncharacterized protein n=1 Tax=Oryza meyeriana var. granulata TaxID=110450 RepID=A0A6G1CMI5_9ORYZ|nr:hypothetical protein E2562_000242 [Oryza meyeriana var. granulata]